MKTWLIIYDNERAKKDPLLESFYDVHEFFEGTESELKDFLRFLGHFKTIKIKSVTIYERGIKK